MKGVIRFINNYSDGHERFEIMLDAPKDFQVIYNEKLNYVLKINDSSYTCAVRSTERNGSWICAYLYNLQAPFEKVRLSEVLIKNRFARNEVVNLMLDKKTKQLTINKI
jgi:hypothetical protein